MYHRRVHCLKGHRIFDNSIVNIKLFTVMTVNYHSIIFGIAEMCPGYIVNAYAEQNGIVFSSVTYCSVGLTQPRFSVIIEFDCGITHFIPPLLQTKAAAVSRSSGKNGIKYTHAKRERWCNFSGNFVNLQIVLSICFKHLTSIYVNKITHDIYQRYPQPSQHVLTSGGCS